MPRAPGTHTAKRPPASGSRKHHQNGKVGLVCYFEADTFDVLRARAVRENTSVAEQIRTLVEWGLESSKEGGQC